MSPAKGTERGTPRVVAMSGPGSALGRVLLPRLLDDESVAKVLAVDIVPPDLPASAKLDFRQIDLVLPSASRDLAAVLAEAKADVFIHLAFFSSPTNAAYAHELEAIGTLNTVTAVGEAGTPRLILSSSTLVYGAQPKNPNFITESQPVVGHSQSRYIRDKVEAERLAGDFARTNPDRLVTVLRFAPILGPLTRNPFTRYLGRPIAPTVLGYDPLVQFLHELDAAHALRQAVERPVAGAVNIVPQGLLPLSGAIRLGGARNLPLPLPWARSTLRALSLAGVTATPPSFVDYLRFLFVADGQRAKRELGFTARFSTRDAVLAFAATRNEARSEAA